MEVQRPPIQLIPSSPGKTRGVFPSAINAAVPRKEYDQALNATRRVTRSGLTVWLNAVTAYIAAHDSPAGVLLDEKTISTYFATPGSELANLRAALQLLQTTPMTVRADDTSVRLADHLWAKSRVFSDAPFHDVVARIRSVRAHSGRPVSVALTTAVYLTVIERIATAQASGKALTEAPSEVSLSIPDVVEQLNSPSREGVGAAMQRLVAAGCLAVEQRQGHRTMRVSLRCPAELQLTPDRTASVPAPHSTLAVAPEIDRVAQLQWVVAAHERGELDADEFRAAKREILGL